ncbi:MAG: S-layer homology domain-containing protein, partial [Deinococcus sp.]|nr:S-layer homology domain-containing protein [Deinococcus sp.]
MRKSIIAATLAMTVGVAGAQAGGGYADNTQYVAPTTTNAPVSGSVVLTDVPAGHWARDAVEAIVKAGLIQGFPDGTFRGNENLTRYQAAMIFHRLLQSGALSGSNISDADLLVITRGMQEVSTELAAISTRLTDVERLTVEQQARIDALEAAIKDMDTSDNSALVARIDALEARVIQLEGANATVP